MSLVQRVLCAEGTLIDLSLEGFGILRANGSRVLVTMIRMADLRVPLTFFGASSSPLRLEHPPGLMTTTSSTTTT
jgi:hypothetical protein